MLERVACPDPQCLVFALASSLAESSVSPVSTDTDNETEKFLSYEWDAIAGIVTAVTASVLHLLHMLNEEVMLSVVLALIALLFINFMRHTRNNEITAEQWTAH